MIICKSCGSENGDSDDFCGTCGNFLEWVGERTAVVEPEPATEVADEAGRPGIIERVKEAIVGDASGKGAPGDAAEPVVEPSSPQPPPAAEAAPVPPPPAPLPPPPTPEAPLAPSPEEPPGASAPPLPPPPAGGLAPSVAPADPDAPRGPAHEVTDAPGDAVAEEDAAAARRRAAALVAKAPPAQPKRSEPRPEERRPGKAVRKRPVAPAASAARIRPGDLICGTCGTGNDPERKFCRRDGTSLATAEVAKVPWWWRFRRKKKVRAAGERPEAATERRRRGGGGAWRVVRIATAVLLAITLVGTLGPWSNPIKDRWNTTYRSVRRKVAPEYYRVRPKGWHESRQLAGQEAEKLSDSDFTTSWSPGGDGVGESVIFVFQERVTLGKVIMGTGNSDYINNPRVESVLISYDDFGRFPVACTVEKPWCHLIDLEDTPKPQTRDMQSKHKVTSVRLTIAGTYDAPRGNAALSEVQFFAIK